MKEIFSEIYKHNMWGGTESVSGPGSSVFESQKLIEKLPMLFDLFEITSILDAPCGDFNWMKHVPKGNISYIGVDIVDEIIQKNNERYAGENVRFMVKNIVEDELPAADIAICRDVFVHLSFTDVKKAVENFRKSGIKYLLATHFPGWTENKDIDTGDWRPLNLCLAPFSYPDPILLMKETTSIKTMALWKISALK
ncbi:SAM-dependent methyltransferase [Neobacillus sp. B4I6]|uniref:class I SAM-dependent methyltransferase n=1 Tax=Neobacillus sp. B4I6 TaxID=3373925 RepID=UPI003D23B72E